jgi:hypothetical protein
VLVELQVEGRLTDVGTLKQSCTKSDQAKHILNPVSTFTAGNYVYTGYTNVTCVEIACVVYVNMYLTCILSLFRKHDV